MQQVLPRADDTTGYYYYGLDCADDHNCTLAAIRYNLATKRFSQHVERTSDGGLTWEIQDLPPREINLGYQTALRGTVAVDSNNIFVFGDSCYIVRTTDAGRTWTNVSYPSYQSLLAGDFTDPENGTFVGTNGTVLMTSDGGDSWTLIEGLPKKPFAAVRMWDNNRVALFHSNVGQILWTEDRFKRLDTSRYVIEQSLLGDTLRWADLPLWFGEDTLIVPSNYQTLTIPYVYRSTIYRTTNRGREWTEIAIDNNYLEEATAINSLPSGEGLIFGKGHHFFRTSDFGRTWAKGALDENVFITELQDVSMISPTQVVITLPAGGGGARVYRVLLDQLQIESQRDKIRLGTVIFPNPTTGELSIQKWYSYESDVRIINVLGEEVLRTRINREPGTSTIDCSKLPNGTYNVLLKYDGNDLPVGKFILMK
jgi:photosystem II stability/assembly factor-like uncharacterized protein